MVPSNSHWLPRYCAPFAFLPEVQETRMLFRTPPYLFQDFVGRAISFLRSEAARKMGFEYDPKRLLPCKWKCSDESVFGVDLCLYAYTGQYPFDKGRIGGRFNETALAAAVHHAPINVDFGGSHVGYQPGADGGSFGTIPRPLHEHTRSTDCGALMATVLPFKRLYDDACENILVFRPEGGRALASIPNEFIQPSWSTHPIKLLVNLEALTVGVVPFEAAHAHTHKLAGRSLFRLHPKFVDGLRPEAAVRLLSPTPSPIAAELTSEYFDIFDTTAEIGHDGVPKERILPYMKHIVSARHAPPALKAAIVNTNLEYNRLTDCLRTREYTSFSFACFTGVIIDVFDDALGAYVNLFQPIGVNIKPAGKTRDFEFATDEIRSILDSLSMAEPRLPLEGVLGYGHPQATLSSFTFRPGHYAGS